MLAQTILNLRSRRCLTIVLFGASAFLSSCATQQPKQTALVADPDAKPGSAIPWNRPASWEGRENLPDVTGNGAFGTSR
jgi:hypothetical protein